MVRLEQVRKSFGDLVVLDGIDLEVSAGDVLVVIGPSGSGKSTLLRCVNLLEPVDSGRIFLEGQEITGKGVDVSDVRQNVGIVGDGSRGPVGQLKPKQDMELNGVIVSVATALVFVYGMGHVLYG